MDDGTSGYGKLLGSGGGTVIAAALVETADQYLPHVLPNSVALALALILSLIGTYLVPHKLTGGNPDA